MIVAILTLLLSGELVLGGHATILLYHRFDDDRYPTTSVSLEDFYKQMKYLKDNGYRVIPLSELVSILERGKDVPDKTVVITIDDAYKSTMKAFEILKEFDYPFTIFLYMEAVARYPDFLTREDIKKLKEWGKVEFQNHSYSHQAFGFDVSIERFVEDLKKSERRFKRLIGKKPTMYAFPYGFYNLALIEILKQRGYKAVFTQDPGNVDSASDIFRLNRQAVVGSWSKMKHFVKKLKRESLHLSEMIPPPGFLESDTPPRIGGRLVDPSTYDKCRIYVSELGWNRVRKRRDLVVIENSKRLKRRWNRIGVKCLNLRRGRWAETFWMVMRSR